MGESRNGQPKVLGIRKKGTCWSWERRVTTVDKSLSESIGLSPKEEGWDGAQVSEEPN